MCYITRILILLLIAFFSMNTSIVLNHMSQITCRADSQKIEELDQIWIPENGVATAFLVISHDQDGYLLIREHTTGPCAFSFFDSASSYYANSAIDNYLQNGYADRFSEEIHDFLIPSSIMITAEESIGCCGTKTEIIERNFFEPSWTEMTGKYNSTSLKEGELFSKMFTRTCLTATNDKGDPSVWWLRTPITWPYYRVLAINEEGGVSSGSTLDSGGVYLADVRPAFRLSAAAPIINIDGQWYLSMN